MAGFRKAKAEQAALKMGIYGSPGAGKTFTALLIGEGLAKMTGKRIAVVDTERGTDFYCQAVPTRPVHPEAFDFDALYTRSITEVLSEVKKIDTEQYGVVILDSITHVWDAAIAAYGGNTTRAGTIPFHAWSKIKKPYKELMSFLLGSPLHVIICGRQKTVYEEDEDTGETKAAGVAMRAEGETPYEPHILIRMEATKPRKSQEAAQIVAYAEKDRTGVLAGRLFVNPTFDSLCKPLLSLLGDKQAAMANGDEAAVQDAEELAKQERERVAASAEILRQFSARIALTNDSKALKALGKEITPQLKARMLPQDVAQLRDHYQVRDEELKGVAVGAANGVREAGEDE